MPPSPRHVRPADVRIDVVSLFPALFPGPLSESIPGRALERGLAELHSHDLREWGLGRHRSVDDYTYGGGAGMVLRPEPVAAALEAVGGDDPFTILMDPGGELFTQARARDLALRSHVVLVCPRYEGVDDRVRRMVDLELSIGDYVLSGGELPALVVIDAVLRLLPGAIDAASTDEESFAAGLLEYPQYTRPPEFAGERVPDVLVGGDHAAVARWRREQALERTRRNRPDLLQRLTDAPAAGRTTDSHASATGREPRRTAGGTERPGRGGHARDRVDDTERWEDLAPPDA
jgi:tRNA (guanine37-N1)-methyltransferase